MKFPDLPVYLLKDYTIVARLTVLSEAVEADPRLPDSPTEWTGDDLTYALASGAACYQRVKVITSRSFEVRRRLSDDQLDGYRPDRYKEVEP